MYSKKVKKSENVANLNISQEIEKILKFELKNGYRQKIPKKTEQVFLKKTSIIFSK